METVRRGGGGSDLVVHGSLSLGPFHSEMDEELTSCLRLRVAFLLGSGSLAGVLCAGPLGHGFPVLVVIEAAVGPSEPRVCPHVLPGGGLHLFPERRDCYLIDGHDWCCWPS